jgi:hypothetical protein
VLGNKVELKQLLVSMLEEVVVEVIALAELIVVYVLPIYYLSRW